MLLRDAPALAETVAARFAASDRHVLATLTVSGGPRVSGTSVTISGEDLVVPVVLRSPKGTDLLGDPRCVLHSNPGDGSMVGDVKITGRATGLVGSDGQTRPHGRDPVDVAVLVEVLELSARDPSTGEVSVTRWAAPASDDAGPAAGTGPTAGTAPTATAAPTTSTPGAPGPAGVGAEADTGPVASARPAAHTSTSERHR